MASAVAILRAGRSVTMLDAGIDLEPERRRIVTELRRQEYDQWDPTLADRIKEGMSPSAKGIPLKMIYGSDFPYQDTERFAPLDQKDGVATASSLALGGFSNVWGASLLPYRDEDIKSWPIGISDLAEHYSAVLSFMDMSARNDDLAALFPLYQADPRSLDLSPQAVAFLKDLGKNRETLRSRGMHFGASRLAVCPGFEGERHGCAYCGLCMYGCPYELIYNTAFTLERLRQESGFTYIPNVIVERVHETKAGVTIEAQDRLTQEKVSYKADRVLLGCGTLATTRIVLDSMQAYDRSLELFDSQYFLFPFVRYRRDGRPRADRLHTLAQLFLEILDPAISPYTVHLQIYTHNDLYLQAMKNTFGPMYYLMKPFVNAAVDRMFVFQGYLHSDHSPSIKLTLERPTGGKPGRMILEPQPKSVPSKDIIRRIVKKVGGAKKCMRAMPLGFMLEVAPAGRGFHSGGAIPMRREPKEFESDILGRPCQFERVHLIDSTTFPSIPATTITFTVMANAHRIATVIANE